MLGMSLTGLGDQAYYLEDEGATGCVLLEQIQVQGSERR